MAEGDPPSDDELIEAISKVSVGDVLVNALTASVSLGFHRLSPEARDLPQARLAIEALRALDPVLRDAGVEETFVRDLEQARASLQLAYAKAVEGGSTSSSAEGSSGADPASPAADEPPGSDAAD